MKPIQPAPRVSVVIATYNRTAYLREALASVLAQTFQAFEVVVVDDGSTDDTRTAVAAFEDERVHYHYQPNAGQSVALNRGLAAAQGEFIAFLDDDDRYLPYNLATQAAFLDANPPMGLVGANVELITAGGAPLGGRTAQQEPGELAWPACLYACPLVPSAVVLRRRWLDALDIWFDPELERFQDVDFWTRLHLAGCRMWWTPLIVSAYRQHPGQMQHDAERYYHSYLRTLDKLFAQSNLPPELEAERPALYGHFHLLGACRAFADSQSEAGQERLLAAAEANPALLQGAPPMMVATLAGMARSVAGNNAPALVAQVFYALPPGLAHLRRWRRHALSALHMQRVFAARSRGTRPHLSDWAQGVGGNPRWLANRGVWSILVRDLLLSRSTPGVRP